jgi:hypothetical protein
MQVLDDVQKDFASSVLQKSHGTRPKQHPLHSVEKNKLSKMSGSIDSKKFYLDNEVVFIIIAVVVVGENALESGRRRNGWNLEFDIVQLPKKT